jgi:UDP-glucose 4-epimerase
MRILILGGAGFIGQHLSHALLEKDRQVRLTVVDNLATANFNKDDFAVYKNLYNFIEGDLGTMPDDELLRLFKKQDKIYHLAGSVGVALGDKKPKETLYNNVRLANKLVPLFDQAKTHVVFSSTSEIYGNGPTFTEEDFCGIGPTSKTRWAYSTSKMLTEFMIRASDCPHTIVRFFNVVGPGQLGDYGMVLPRFVQAAKAGEDLIVHGNGSQVRSFCHINDAVESLIKVASIPNELFNLGNSSEPISMLNLAERVIALSNSTSKIKLVPYEEVFSHKFEDIDYRVPNTEKLIKHTGLVPKYTLDDIIKDML